MKKILSIVAVIAALSLNVKAGEQYFPTSGKGGTCGTTHCCEKTAYIFGFGGANFGDTIEGTVFGGPFGSGGAPLNLDLGDGFSYGAGVGWKSWCCWW